MKKHIKYLTLVILILLSNNIFAQAYYFATDIETKVISLDEDGCELVVLQHDDKDNEEVFPIDTILKGKFYEYNFRRHFMRDEYVKLHFYEAVLPNGTVQKIDNDIKVRPRVIFNSKHNIQLLGAAASTVLKATIAVWSVGFPVGRGVKAVTDAAYGVYNTPAKENKWAEGLEGFVLGALFPLPEIILKGEEVPLHDESYLWIQDANEEQKKLTAFVIKRKNIFLSKGKYYADVGKEMPNYSKYLKEKDMFKYQKKLARKSVQFKQMDIDENLVQELELSKDEITEVQDLSTEMEVEETQREAQDHSTESHTHTHNWQRSWRKPKVL